LENREGKERRKWKRESGRKWEKGRRTLTGRTGERE